MIYFINTLSGKKELFKPQHDKKVSLYVCGITPYDYAHVGHGRCYVTFDLIFRLLQFSGYQVTYCRNFTDIDDKILKRAELEYGASQCYEQVTQKYMAAFDQDMQKLNCIAPAIQPLVTKTIPEIIAFVQGLLDKGMAYEHDGSVYFRVASYKEYGKLSKQSIDQLLAGARVHVDACKENPLDFALWKQDAEVGFASPWGQGRPGWHIECSAMAHQAFGDSTVDIHGGGMDLMFPHHENEIAQSESLYDQPFVSYWLHNAFVRVKEEKMSKSLGNFFTLHDLFKQFDPMVVRFYFLKQHYRNPLDFSLPDLQATEKAYRRLVEFFNDITIASVTASMVQQHNVTQQMLTFLQDDLNTSGALGILFEHMHDLTSEDKRLVKYVLVHIFGLSLAPLPEKTMQITERMQELLQQREQARKEKNWALADQIRDQLSELGYQVHDKKLS